MSRLFSLNAYSVLGLDTGVSQKEISRRSKEIINLLKIDEIREYDTDLGSINVITRSEPSINDAVKRLSSPIKRIQEYFFWFEIENDLDEKDLALLRDNQYDEALDNWKKRAEKSLTSKRNLAIASSLLLNHTGYKKYLKMSVDAWSEVVNSDKFWSHFEKVYALNDEIGTSNSAIDDFRSKVLDYLSDFYADVSRVKKDKSIYAAFSAIFEIKGQKVQDEILAPIFDQINSISEQLRKLNVSDDSILSSQESMTIRRLVKKIQDLFQEIKDLGLYEDSQSKVMRDKAAEAINIVAVDLFNNLDESTKSIALVKVAKSFAAGPAVISQINKNVDTMSKVTAQGNIIKPINDLIEKEQYSQALEMVNEQQEKYKEDTVLQEYFRKRIQWCVTAVATRDFNDAHSRFESGDYVDASSWFGGVFDFVYQYVDSFEINSESLDNVINTLRKKLAVANADTLSDIDSYRQSIIDNSDESIKDKDKFELTIITILLDSVIYQRLAEIIPEIKKRNNVQRAKNVVWRIVGWIVGFVILAAIGGAFNGGSSSSNNGSNGSSSSGSSNSAWQACSTEYDSLKSQLDSVESSMSSYKSSGSTDAYNALVPRQNSLVQQVNNKATECNNLR